MGKTRWEQQHNTWVLRQIVLAVYTKQTFKCANCGFDDIDCLSLDHINDDSKHNHNKYTCGSQNYNEAKRDNFPDKFQVLCRNCNWIKELERRRLKVFMAERKECSLKQARRH